MTAGIILIGQDKLLTSFLRSWETCSESSADIIWSSQSEIGGTTWIISWQADIWSSQSEIGGTTWIISWQDVIWSSESEIGETILNHQLTGCHLKFTIRDWRDYLNHQLAGCHLNFTVRDWRDYLNYQLAGWHHLKFTVRDWRYYLHHHLTCCHLSCSQIGGTTWIISWQAVICSHRLEWHPESSADRLSSEDQSSQSEIVGTTLIISWQVDIHSQRFEWMPDDWPKRGWWSVENGLI